MTWAKIDGRVQEVDVVGHQDVNRYKIRKMREELGLPASALPKPGRYFDVRILGKLKAGKGSASAGRRLVHEEDMR